MLFTNHININQVVSLDENELISNIKLYPNPTSNFTTANIELKKESSVSVNIVNTLGQTVKQIISDQILSQGSNNIMIERGSLKSGIYFVSIEINETRRLEKLIIQ
jgi:hypothetical protein